MNIYGYVVGKEDEEEMVNVETQMDDDEGICVYVYLYEQRK